LKEDAKVRNEKKKKNPEKKAASTGKTESLLVKFRNPGHGRLDGECKLPKTQRTRGEHETFQKAPGHHVGAIKKNKVRAKRAELRRVVNQQHAVEVLRRGKGGLEKLKK